QRAQGNRPERACLPPAGEWAINVVQRAAHIHVGLPALGYLLTIEAVSRRTGAPWSKLAPKDNSAPPILPAAFGSRDSHVENVGGARSEREDPDVDLELLWAGAARASRRCISLPFGPRRRYQRRLGQRPIGLQQGIREKQQPDFVRAGCGALRRRVYCRRKPGNRHISEMQYQIDEE